MELRGTLMELVQGVRGAVINMISQGQCAGWNKAPCSDLGEECGRLRCREDLSLPR